MSLVTRYRLFWAALMAAHLGPGLLTDGSPVKYEHLTSLMPVETSWSAAARMSLSVTLSAK